MEQWGGTRQMLDPTTRTTEVLLREIASLKELFGTKFDAMQDAVRLLQSNADKSPTVAVVYEKVLSLEAVNKEKFESITKQFAERDTRTEQTSRDNKVAIDAALQAQKEAVAKSEVGFTKQIDNITTLIATQGKGADDKIDSVKSLLAAQAKSAEDKIDDIKTRQTASEGGSKGIINAWGIAVGVVTVVIGLIVVVFVILTFASRNGVTP